MKKNMKTLTSAAAAHILGSKANIRLEGPREKVSIVLGAIKASKDLYESMKNPDSNLPYIHECLEKKHAAAKRFREEFGEQWPF